MMALMYLASYLRVTAAPRAKPKRLGELGDCGPRIVLASVELEAIPRGFSAPIGAVGPGQPL